MSTGIRFKFILPRGNFNLNAEAEIPGNGVTAFFGRSGSGKTSLLRCIAGLEHPKIAFLSVNGDIWHDSKRGIFVPAYRREIGYVFQEGALFPKMTVKKNLLFGYRRTPKFLRRADFDHVVDLLGLKFLLNRLPSYLSGGEKQRVAIGRALLNHPRLLLMDEPMASLDQVHKKEILPYLENLHENFNIPIVYITHDRQEMINIANHIILIEEGKLIAQGPLNQVLTRMDLAIAYEPEAASVIDTEVIEHDEKFHLTKLAFPGGELYVSQIRKQKGTHLRIRILANDISISLKHPDKTSIINVLPAVVEEMKTHERGRMVVRLNIGGIPVLAAITQKSYFLLGLKTGNHVFALIKSMALFR